MKFMKSLLVRRILGSTEVNLATLYSSSYVQNNSKCNALQQLVSLLIYFSK